MKIGIFTFHCAQNYGAVLQTYGLQEYLLSLGHDVYVIDYRPDYLTAPYKIFTFKWERGKANFWTFLREILTVPIRLGRLLLFKKFVSKNLRLYKLDLNQKDNDFDAFIYGSDQIWNPKLTGGFDDVYFGKIPAATNKQLFSYAASVGDISHLTSSDKAYLKDALGRFTAISVRENDFQELLNNEIGLNSCCVCDPVLLAGDEIFDRLTMNAPCRLSKNKYLMLFQLEVINDTIISYAKKIATSLAIDFVNVISRRETLDRSIHQCLSAESFLNYIKNSSLVFTTSYHGTVFSILYRKQFYTISVNPSVDSRALSLLSAVGLESRLINTSQKDIRSINYNDIESSLMDYVRLSRNFVNNNLK